MAKFITINAEGYGFGQEVLNLDTIKRIELIWHALDDDDLTVGGRNRQTFLCR